MSATPRRKGSHWSFPSGWPCLGRNTLKSPGSFIVVSMRSPVSPFVVGFNRVGFDAMFDPDPFGSILEVAGDFSLKIAVDFSSQEAHHIATGEGLNAMENQSRINRCDIGGFSERHIGRPFALKDRPVIASPESTKHPGVGRVELARHARQRFVPRNAQLPFHQLLGFGKIVDPRENSYRRDDSSCRSGPSSGTATP